MRHDGGWGRDGRTDVARRRPRDSRLLLSGLLAILVAGCSGESIQFIGDPLPGDPLVALITLDQCDCDRCRVVVADPESGEVVFNMLHPPLDQQIVADACYNTSMIRIVVECGGCTTAGSCNATATLALDDGSGTPLPKAPSVTCATLAGPSATCSDGWTFDISGEGLINPACPR